VFGGPRVSFGAERKVNRSVCGIHRAVDTAYVKINKITDS